MRRVLFVETKYPAIITVSRHVRAVKASSRYVKNYVSTQNHRAELNRGVLMGRPAEFGDGL